MRGADGVNARAARVYVDDSWELVATPTFLVPGTPGLGIWALAFPSSGLLYGGFAAPTTLTIEELERWTRGYTTTGGETLPVSEKSHWQGPQIPWKHSQWVFTDTLQVPYQGRTLTARRCIATPRLDQTSEIWILLNTHDTDTQGNPRFCGVAVVCPPFDQIREAKLGLAADHFLDCYGVASQGGVTS